MTHPTTGYQTAIELCEHLGLDPNHVTKLVVTMDPQQTALAVVTADVLIDEDGLAVLKQFTFRTATVQMPEQIIEH